MDVATLMFSTLFGSIGVGFWIYGRKQQKAIPLFVGIALSVFPFFVSNPIAVFAIGIGLCALPFFVSI
jgi:hypothetical protein